LTTLIVIYSLLAICLVLSLLKSRQKTKQSFVVAAKALWKMAPGLLAIVGVVGLILGLLPPETITRLVGAEAGFLATATAAVLGAVTLIPALISFPLAASLLRSGATVTTIAAFITTLVMVGFVTAPMEIKALGRKFTLLRNGLSFAAALVIALLMGVILK
jgi:uncharacterized membrane protein YraQ (UPF0718 family)